MLQIKTFIRRIISIFFTFKRPSSFPFITGDTFRASAQHIHDEFLAVRPSQVKQGDIIFVKTNFLKEFFDSYVPRIFHSFILVTHNSDIEIDSTFQSYVDNKKVIHWFGQNISLSHTKCSPLPIGLENKVYGRCTLGNDNQVIKSTGEKNKLCMMALHTINIHPERQLAITIAEHIDWIERFQFTSEKYPYYKKVYQYKYIISPRGAGIDCHRTWEALLLETIPIVIKNSIHQYFYDQGIPLFMVAEWNDLKNITPEQLEEFYSIHKGWFTHDSIMIPYWLKLIQASK